MRIKTITITTVTFLILSCTFQTPVSSFGSSGNPGNPVGQYALTNVGVFNRFFNYVDGYSLLVDKTMTVDMSYSAVCATLSNDVTRIQIFNQSLSGSSRNTYQYYSNGFLKNTVDHFLEYQDYQTISGRNVHVTQWRRNKLLRVYNDKNYYVCLDIPSHDGELLTVFISSTLPIYQIGGYTYLVDELQFFPKTGAGYIKKAANTIPSSRGWNTATKAFFENYFGTSSSLKWGVFEPTFPDNPYVLKQLEATMDYTFPIVLNYTGMDNKNRHNELDMRLQVAQREGKILELTLQTLEVGPWESNQIYQILNGEYDEFLKNYADSVVASEQPVLFRVGNEMNGDWCPYSGYQTSRDPSLFVEFYRYVYDFFRRAGANNIIWVWNPNGKSFPDFKWNNEIMYYPGDDYVDVIGLTLYNTGNYYPGEHWTGFAELYDNVYYPYLNKYDKPFMITEFACALLGGDKNQWIINMFNHIKYYNRIKVAVWWNGADYDSEGNTARSYFMNDPMSLIPIFRNGFNGIEQIKQVDHSWKENVFA